MAFCSAYGTPICSLCCTLEARCRDQCKTKSRIADQLASVLDKLLPGRLAAFFRDPVGQFSALFVVFIGVAGGYLP